MIVLVGRGWADDDPVLGYKVLVQTCTDAGSVANDARGYAPNDSLGCDDDPTGGTRPGAPAMHTDHRPMGARLRV